MTFLTTEREQGTCGGPHIPAGCSSQLVGTDLNRDCDDLDLVLQVFNVRAARYALEHPHAATARATAETGIPNASLAGLRIGTCTDTEAACTEDAQCGADATCFFPPGSCVVDTGRKCDPKRQCSAREVCFPPQSGTCHKILGACQNADECRGFAADAKCIDTKQGTGRQAQPLAKRNAGAKVLVAAGRCVEPLVQSCATSDCPAGSVCRQQQCERRDAPCRTDADCPAGTCRSDVVTATAEDTDGDEVPDVVDNCPFRSNPDQADDDGNHVAMQCEVALAACPSEATVGTLSCRVDALDGEASQCLLDARFRGKLDKLVRRMQATLLRAERSSKRAAGLRRVRHDLRSYRRLLASRRGREVLASTGCDDLVARTDAIAGAVAALLDAEP